MAKIEIGPRAVKFWDIHWDEELDNYRQAGDYGDEKEQKALQSSLARLGWYKSETPTVVVADKAFQDRAVKYRTTMLEDLEQHAAKDTKARDLLFILKGGWLDSKGKVKVPELRGNSHFRRARLYPASLAERMNMPDGEKSGVDPVDDINVIVCKYDSDADRLVDQLFENEKKLEGRRDVGFETKLRAAKSLYEAGYYESKMRNAFRDGTGQKLFAILEVNRLAPDVKLYDRCFLPPEDARYVKADSLAPNLMRPLYKDKKVPTAQEVEDVLTKIKGGQVNVPKIANRQTIESLAKNNPNVIVRRIAQAIVDNKTDVAHQMLAPMAAHCDVVEKWVMAGKGKELLDYLNAFKA